MLASVRMLFGSGCRGPLLLLQPKHRVGYLGNCLFSLSGKIFSESEYPTFFLLILINRSTMEACSFFVLCADVSVRSPRKLLVVGG